MLYQVIAAHLETFLALLHDDPDAKGLPAYVEREFYDYLQCGVLAYGFLRVECDTCPKETLLAFSCNLHYHVVVVEGVFLDRTDQGLTPHVLKGEPPSDADVAEVIQKISRR